MPRRTSFQSGLRRAFDRESDDPLSLALAPPEGALLLFRVICGLIQCRRDTGGGRNPYAPGEIRLENQRGY